MVMKHAAVYQPIGAGVKEDCEALLEDFKNSQSVRFDDFVTCWQEHKFALIFTGRQNMKEQMEFSEEVMRIAKGFLMPSYAFHTRMGGLYLLYSLYFKQPIRYWARIRVTVGEWRELMEFMSKVEQELHHDALFVFKTLQFRNAFQYTGQSVEMGPEFVGVQSNEHCVSVFAERDSGLKNYLEEGILDQLSSIHSKYYGMKCALAGVGSSAPESSLDTIFREIVPGLNKLVAEYEGEMGLLTRADKDGGQPAELPEHEWLNRRKELKAKALGIHVEKPKSVYHRKKQIKEEKKQEREEKKQKKEELKQLREEKKLLREEKKNKTKENKKSVGGESLLSPQQSTSGEDTSGSPKKSSPRKQKTPKKLVCDKSKQLSATAETTDPEASKTESSTEESPLTSNKRKKTAPKKKPANTGDEITPFGEALNSDLNIGKKKQKVATKSKDAAASKSDTTKPASKAAAKKKAPAKPKARRKKVKEEVIEMEVEHMVPPE